MAILTLIRETIDAGDPIVRSWPLVGSVWTPFVWCCLYVIFVKRIGPFLMKDRKPFDLRILMIVYNLAIVFTYVICLLTLLYYLFTTDGYRLICASSAVFKNHYTYYCASAGWVIYTLKYIEFADTIFFILRKKNHLVTNLHVIHHAALPCICWIMLRTETSGFQFIPAGINSFIHIIMYAYYGLVAMGPEVRKKLWWKEYLTLLQMAQFVVILFLQLVVQPLIGCKTSTHGIYMVALFATLFLALFLNFYIHTYNRWDKIIASSNGVHKSNGKLSAKES